MRISDWSSDVCSSDLAERLLARDADAAIRSVEQALVRFDHARGERRGVDREAVVHAGDLAHAVFGPLHRVVGAAMAPVPLDRLRPDGAAQHLVAAALADKPNVAMRQAP